MKHKYRFFCICITSSDSISYLKISFLLLVFSKASLCCHISCLILLLSCDMSFEGTGNHGSPHPSMRHRFKWCLFLYYASQSQFCHPFAQTYQFSCCFPLRHFPFNRIFCERKGRFKKIKSFILHIMNGANEKKKKQTLLPVWNFKEIYIYKKPYK